MIFASPSGVGAGLVSTECAVVRTQVVLIHQTSHTVSHSVPPSPSAFPSTFPAYPPAPVTVCASSDVVDAPAVDQAQPCVTTHPVNPSDFIFVPESAHLVGSLNSL